MDRVGGEEEDIDGSGYVSVEDERMAGQGMKYFLLIFIDGGY